MNAGEVTVVARIVALPESIEALRSVLRSLIEPTRAEVECVSYAFFQDAERPTHFISIERWTSAAAAAAHMDTPHVKAALAAVGPLLAEPPEIRPYLPV